ncbi:MAG: bifunctional 3-(3-hydroxy-phenyl)propionate/3-hydroxycinnamic acid hydroxylase [Beijerinckiaceae bacterium]|nr:bifunctional 3-(3-hydroxy-phenyl)propionate/3-hydroxycinnamic acid hydroxylase [Beijerinckiaceae bacterium]
MPSTEACKEKPGLALAAQTKTYQVGIVGFGPVGAMVANLMGRAGVRALALDRTPEIFPKPRAIALDHEILRAFDNIGVLGRILPWLEPFTASEHFGVDGQLIRRIDMAPAPYPLGYVPSQVFLQPPVERELRDNLASFPCVDVMLGREFVSLRQDSGKVEVEARKPDGDIERFTFDYLIGCDGAASSVRRATGMKLDDLGFDEPWLVIDVLVNEQGRAKLPQRSAQYCNATRPTTYLVGPQNLRRWEITILPGEDPKACEQEDHVWSLLAPWISREDGELWRASSYRFHALVAGTWREGRVFIAGDAAHQQPPFIGQGMCQGIRDAVNLSWKLIDRMNGAAADSVLDTYETERAAHVRELTGRIKAIGKYISERDPALARARDERLLAEGGGQALTVTRQEIVPPLTQGFLHAESGAIAGTLFPQPWIESAAGPKLMDEAAGGGWRLVMFGVDDAAAFTLSRAAGALNVTPVRFADAGGADATALAERDGVVRGWFARAGACVALVRPDHYVYGVASNAPAAAALIDHYSKARQGAA